jgi:phosphomannomutase/phosphoglucomutase
MSNISKTVFRAYDVRGVATGEAAQLTPEFAYLLGRAYAELLSAELGHAPRLVLGRDNRPSGQALVAALAEGAASAGASVDLLGFAVSPYLYFAVCYGQYDGGINVTGSHNPAEYNGFKMTRTGAAPFAGEDILRLYDSMVALAEQPPTDAVTAGQIAEVDLRAEYLAKLVSLATPVKPLKLVVDCGSGTACYFAPEYLRQLGHEVVELYCEPDPTFPHHLPNPEDEASLTDLIARVRETGADLGLAFDGDGDRVGLVDATGRIVAADKLLILLARDTLSRNAGATVIFDGKCTELLPVEVTKAGGVPLRWKTGHSLIKQKLKDTGALLAGEVSGHIFFAEEYYGFDDGLLAAGKLAALTASGGSVSDQLADLPTMYATPELKLPIADSVKFATMERVAAALAALPGVAADTLDGVRIAWGDGAWCLVRPSNTTPCFTLRAEALTPARLDEVLMLVREALAEFPVVDLAQLPAAG